MSSSVPRSNSVILYQKLRINSISINPNRVYIFGLPKTYEIVISNSRNHLGLIVKCEKITGDPLGTKN